MGTLARGEVDPNFMQSLQNISLPEIQTVRHQGFSGMALTKAKHRSPATLGRKGVGFDYTPVNKEAVARKKVIPVSHLITATQTVPKVGVGS